MDRPLPHCSGPRALPKKSRLCGSLSRPGSWAAAHYFSPHSAKCHGPCVGISDFRSWQRHAGRSLSRLPRVRSAAVYPLMGKYAGRGRELHREPPCADIAPGFAITLAVVALNFVGDALRDALDPRSTTGMSRIGCQARVNQNRSVLRLRPYSRIDIQSLCSDLPTLIATARPASANGR